MSQLNDSATQRLAALARYDVLDTPREAAFDEITALAAKLCEAPIAAVNLIGDGRQFFKAAVGLGVRGTPLDGLFCAEALLEDDFLLVPDAAQDPRFERNPLVAGEPHLRFYAGALLKTQEGVPIGTLCVLDHHPRQLTALQQETLRVLARQVMAHLEMRRAVANREARFEAASASEQRLRLVLDSARDYAIITTDEQRRITSWSAGAQATFEWSEQEALGRLIDDIFTPEDRAAGVPAEEIAKARAAGCAPDVRWHVRADGSCVFMNGSTHPIVMADDRLIGFLKIARNETGAREQTDELARTRAELVASEARFRNMADNAPVMMWMTEPDGSCTYLNRSWYAFTGQREAEALGFGWLDATHPEDKPAAERMFVEANAAHAPFRAEYRLRRADGTYRWAIDAASPRFGADGAFLGYIGSVIDIDERRAAEDALRRANVLLEAVMEAVPGVVYAKDQAGRMLAANRGTVDLVGKPLAAIIGRTDAEFLADAAQAEAVMANDARVMAENRPEVLEESVSRPDGSRATWLSTKAPFRDAQGAVVGLVGSSIDITQRKDAEERLRESQIRLSEERTRLATLIESLPVGVCFLTPAGDVLLSNPAYRRFLPDGVLPSRLADPDPRWTGWDERGAPLSRDAYPGARALRGEATGGTEFLYRTADGDKWVRVSGVPLGADDGKLAGAIIVLIDTTEQKHAQEALRRLNESLETQVAERTAERDRMWRLSTDLMLVARFDATITAINPAWTTLLGWSEDDLIGRRFIDLVHPEDRESTLAQTARLSEGLPTLRFENRYQHKDGSYRSLSWTAVPDQSFIHAVARDMEAERKARGELEQAQEQLRQAQKMEAVGQLTGGIAHDFNNLLTGIIGSLDMMQRRIARGETEALERYATAAITSANRAAALTHRLLAFSRRQPLDPKPVNANRLVTGMEELLRRTIGEAIRLEMVTAGGLWQTLCDPHQLESAILNLAINARDAMPEGGTLTIETCNAHLDDAYSAQERDVRPGQYICICVTDTGFGMTQDTIQKVFEPFFTTKPIGQGTGLGLSMIYGFARQSEGFAKIYSEVGKGTTFKLYLPRYYGEGEEAEDQATALADEHRAGHGEVVLVVEDETAVRALVVDVLEELGYRAIEAVDGPSGLKLLHSSLRIDLLVTDIGLPGLNGRQLADAARERRPDLKILFMTGYAENATIANGFLEPGMEMITKPFAIDALAGRIRTIIEAQRA
ncbi:PAS domain S-box protein [Sphingomonas xinjiangensis]|uniref:histidine kinase n=1 Tax=Sphingomonas xinjiangensis TaxID=643568 RepID=A0A840YMM4_9SPHN|nr:PAS domain S-box protein [Sphingomonas xinjiangensis]MBB5711156.1 PAS domain S-box-containing protein [Sphingomonas xinjiangensis]